MVGREPERLWRLGVELVARRELGRVEEEDEVAETEGASQIAVGEETWEYFPYFQP